MAKTLESNPSVLNDLNDKVIIQAGPGNDKPNKGDDGMLYNILIPRRLAPYANEAVAFVSANFHGKREANGKFGDYTDLSAKIAAIEAFMLTWTPKEAALRSPVEQAIYERLVERFPAKMATLSPEEVAKVIATNLNDPAKVESTLALVDAYLPKMRVWSQKRRRQGEDGATETATAEELDSLSID